MNQKKLKSIAAAVVTFIVVGLLAVQAMYYLKHYPPATSMLKHQFLVAIGFLIGIVAASFVYTYLQGDDKSSWLDDDKGKKD
jgi:H+/Cl- antiporter ClcA